MANWLWYFVVLAVGFLLPRMIDTHQGKEILGIWDIGWSLATWISLLSLSVAAAVNRYVARYRAVEDWTALNQAFNSCLMLLGLATCVGFAIGVMLAWFLPHIVSGYSAELITTGRIVVVLLSASVAIQICGGAFNGVITGYERFGVLNVIRVGRDVGVFVAMAGLLFGGYGLVAVATARIVGDVCGEIAKVAAARRICRPLRFSMRDFRMPVAREMVGFGAKAAAQNLSRAGMYQGNSLIVAHFLGLGSLAVYTRQRSLVMHMMRFIKQYAQVFIPRSSLLQARGDEQALRALAIKSSRYALYATLPIVVGLIILGGPLLEVWMGADYVAPRVLAVLAVGHMLTGIHQTMFMLSLGLNQHARPAWYEFFSAIASVTLGFVLIGVMNWGIVGAALAVAIPNAVCGGMLIPLHTCLALGLGVGSYIKGVVIAPFCAMIPLTLALLAVCVAWAGQPVRALLVGIIVGSIVLGATYWVYVIPKRIKKKCYGYCRLQLHA